MDQPAPRLCVVCPCYNEESVLPLFYNELKPTLAAMTDLQSVIIFVDDGSSDGSLAKLNELAAADPAVQVLSLSRNFGHQVALTAGLDFARADALVMMDSDLQHPPTLIPEMVRLWRAGYDVVSAIREQTAGASWFKRNSSSLFYRVFNLLSDVKLADGAADFCLLSQRAHEALRSMPERHRLLRGMIAWAGFKRAFLPYKAPARAAGESKYNLGKMVSMAIDSVFSFSAVPIRIASRLGLFIIFLAGCYFCYIVLAALLYGNTVRGWGSIVTLILGLGGTQLLFIGLIGEYLSRVYEESKDRPLYFLKQAPSAIQAIPRD